MIERVMSVSCETLRNQELIGVGITNQRHDPLTGAVTEETLHQGQAANNNGACLVVKNIGKPCTGKPYARFDEGGQVSVTTINY